jgi:hypothetical protein
MRLPMLSVEAGRIGLRAGGGGVVGGTQMVDQLLPVLVVKEGQRQLLQQIWRQVPVVGQVVLPVVVTRPRRR